MRYFLWICDNEIAIYKEDEKKKLWRFDEGNSWYKSMYKNATELISDAKEARVQLLEAK